MAEQGQGMRVRIIGTTTGTNGAKTWYADKVGQEIIVKDIGTSVYYQDIENYGLVFKKDCELVRDDDPVMVSNIESEPVLNPLAVQVGGDHYKAMKIQPVEFAHANNLPFIEGSIIKYVCRHRQKHGRDDLEKAKHFIDLLLGLEYDKNP